MMSEKFAVHARSIGRNERGELIVGYEKESTTTGDWDFRSDGVARR